MTVKEFIAELQDYPLDSQIKFGENWSLADCPYTSVDTDGTVWILNSYEEQ